MEKLDLTKAFKRYYTAKTTPETLEIEPARFVSISGKGDPSSESFAGDIQLLYPVAYGVKAICKATGQDFGVPKLEGQWWFDEQAYGHISPAEAPQKVPRSAWEYRLLIRMPDFVDEKMVEKAVESVVKKKKLLTAERVQYFAMTEGLCIQMMHIGAFAEEPVTLQKIMEYAEAHQLAKNGLHHEIYLSDFRNTPPEKLKTILREPVKKA